MSARIRGASTELQELGEEEDQYTKSTSKMRKQIKAMTGFDIMKDEAGTEFKDIYDIVVGIGEQWDHLNDITRASLLEMIGGKRGVNSLAAVMNNIDRVKEIYRTAEGAEGSAIQENEAYQRSVQASIDKAKAQIQELAHDFMKSDMLKGLIDAARVLLDIADQIVNKFTTLGTVLAGFGVGSLFKGFVLKDNKAFIPNLLKSIFNAGGERINLNAFGELLKDEISKTGVGGAYTLVSDGFNNIDEATEALDKINGISADDKLSLINLAFGQVEKSADGASESVANATTSLSALTRMKNPLTTLKQFGIGLWEFAKANWVGIAIAGIAAVTYGFIKAEDDKQKALAEQGRESAKTWEKTKESLESYASKYKSLQEQLNSATSDEETLDIKLQLLDLQQQIVDQYGVQAEGIDFVNGKLEEELAVLESISQEHAKQNLEENFASYQQALNRFKTSNYIGEAQLPKKNKYDKNVKQTIESLIENSGNFTLAELPADLLLKKNPSLQLKLNEGISFEDSKTAIDDLRSQLNDLVNETGDAYAKAALKAVEALDKSLTNGTAGFEDTEKALIEQLVAYIGGSEPVKKLKEAGAEVTKAVLSADPEAVDETKATYEEALQEVLDLVKDGVSFEYGGETLFAGREHFDDMIDSAMSAMDQKQLEYFYRSELFNTDKDYKISKSNPFVQRAEYVQKQAEIIKAAELDAADAEILLLDAMDKRAKMNVAQGGGMPTELSNSLSGLSELQQAFVNICDVIGIDFSTGYKEFISILGDGDIVLASTEDQLDELTNSFNATKSDIESAMQDLSALPSIVAEGLSGTGLSADSLQSFRAIFGDDADKALRRTANGIKINREALNDLQRSYTTTKIAEYNKELQHQRDELNNVENQLRSTSEEGKKASLETRSSAIKDQINDLKDLISMYEGATSAYNQWAQAQSAGEERDLYESIFGPYENYKKELQNGNFADDELRAWLEMMTGMKDASLMTLGDIKKAFEDMEKDLEGSTHSLMDFYTESDGSVTAEGLHNFLEAVHESFGDEFAKYSKEEGWTVDFSEAHIQEIMDKWPVGRTPIDAMIAAMADAWDVNGLYEVSPEKRAYDAKSYLQSHTGADFKFSDIEIKGLEEDPEKVNDAIELTDRFLANFKDLDQNHKGLDSAIDLLQYLHTLKGDTVGGALTAEEQAQVASMAEDARSYLQGHTGSDYKFSEIDLGSLDGNITDINSAIKLTQDYIDNFGDTDPSGLESAQTLMTYLMQLKESYEELHGTDNPLRPNDHRDDPHKPANAETDTGTGTPYKEPELTFEESVTKGLGDTSTAISDAASDIGGKIDEANGILSEIAGRNKPNGGSNGKPKKPVAPLKTQEEEYQIPEYDPTWRLPDEPTFTPIPESLIESGVSGQEFIDAIEDATESVDKVGEETENRNGGEQTAMHEMQKQLEMNAAVKEARKQMLYNNNPVNDKFQTFQEKEESINAGVTGETGEGTGTEPGEINVNSAVVNVDKAEEQEGQGQTSESSTGYGGNGQPKPETDKGTYGIDAYGNPIQEDINQPPQDIHADAVNVITGEIGTATDGTGTSDEPTKQNEEYGEAVEDVGDLADDATGQVAGLGTALEGVAAEATAILGGFGAAERDTANGAGIQRFIESNSPSAPSPTQQYETVEPQEQVVKIRVDSEEAVKGVRDLAQEIQDLDGETQASIGINTEEAQAAIENLASLSDADIEAGVTINQEDLDVLESAIGAMSDDVKMQVGLDTAEVDQYIGDEHNTDGKVIFNPEDSAVQSYSAPTKSGTVYYSISPMDWSPLEVPEQYKNQNITIHVNRVDNGGGGAPEGQGTGVNGTAHASGTWGVKNDEDTLINEVGEEIIVNLFSDITWRHVLKTYLIAGKPLEPYVPQRNHEIWVGVMV